MSGYNKHKKVNLVFLLIILFVFIGCKKEETPKTIVAKVGERTLTEQQLDTLLSFTVNKNKYREEVIRDWVDSEVLYLEAQNKNLLSDEDYRYLVDENNKMLANAFLIKRYLAENEIKLDEATLSVYYNSHKNEMAIPARAFVFNQAVFNDEAKAILFRETLLESDWSKATNVFSGDESIVSLTNEKYLYEYNTQSKRVHAVLNNLEEGETSIIFTLDDDSYNIIQLIKNYEAQSIPDFIYMKKFVEERYLIIEKSRLYDNLINQLYSKYDVLINR